MHGRLPNKAIETGAKRPRGSSPRRWACQKAKTMKQLLLPYLLTVASASCVPMTRAIDEVRRRLEGNIE